VGAVGALDGRLPHSTCGRAGGGGGGAGGGNGAGGRAERAGGRTGRARREEDGAVPAFFLHASSASISCVWGRGGGGVSIEYRAVECSGRSCCLARRHMVWPEGTQLLCWLVLKMKSARVGNVTPGPSIVRVRDFLTFFFLSAVIAARKRLRTGRRARPNVRADGRAGERAGRASGRAGAGEDGRATGRSPERAGAGWRVSE